MEYRILGPLEISDGGRALPVSGARQRALLAVLLLARNETVPSDRLIDDVWHGEPPASGNKALHVQVSALRKALGGNGLIETHGAGYRLRVQDGALDVDRFEALLAAGRRALATDPDRAASVLRDALDLWRGPALADLAYEPFAQTEIARLEDRRLACLEDRIEADLALGRQADLVGELEALVARYPLRERLRAQLMLALYRSGRQAEALAVYQDVRRTFAEQIGLEPSPMLRELERKILNQDPVLSAPERAAGSSAGRVAAAARHRPRLLAAAGALIVAGAVAAAVVQLSKGDDGGGLASVEGNAVAVIDPQTGEIVAQVPVGNSPTVVAADAKAVWVLNADDRTVSRIDPDTKEVRTLGTGSTPVDLAVGDGAVWIANGVPDERAQFLGPVLASVARVDPGTNTVRATIEVEAEASSFVSHGRSALALAAGSVWVARRDGAVARIDGRSGRLVATVRQVAAIAIASDGRVVWVIDTDGTLKRISPATNAVTARVRLDASALDSLVLGAGAVWATSSIDGIVWRIDVGRRVVALPIQVGRGVSELAFGEGVLWAVNPLQGTVTSIDPEKNEPRETIEIGNTPREAAVAAGYLWVTVQGSSGASAASSSGEADRQALPSSSCGPVYRGGSGRPDLLIASDFPLQGGLRFSTVQMEEAVVFVLRERGFRAGRFDVAYQSCDDSLASTGIFDEAKCESNAKAYAANELVVGVIGTVNSGCAFPAIPILNEAPGGPLAMISPLNSLPELTRPGPGEAPAEWLASLYPTGERNYARVYPTDDYQGAALALVAQRRGAQRVAVVHDAEDGYGTLLAESFREAAQRLGLDVVADGDWDPQADGYAGLARRIAASDPEAVFVGGLLDGNGARVVVDLRAELGSDVAILVPDGFTPLPLFSEQAGKAAEGVYVSLLGLPVPEQAGGALTPRGREFVAAFGATQPGGVDPSALFAAQATEVLLDAIARSDGTRASVSEELFATEIRGGILGSFRFDDNGDTTLNPVSIYRVVGGGGQNEIMGVDGAVLDRVVTPPPELVHG